MTSGGRGRVLGLDVGDRRIGVAISDPDRHFALPLRSIDRLDSKARNADLDAIATIVSADGVDELVVGLPLTLAGVAGPQAESATAYAHALEAHLNLPVHLYDERLSTQEAMRHVGPEQRSGGGRRDRSRGPAPDIDAIAASIILQAYLDSLHGGAQIL